MKEWFIKWGYPEAVIEKEIQQVYFSKQGQKSEKVEKGVPFYPLLNKLTSIIHKSLYVALYESGNQKYFYFRAYNDIQKCQKDKKLPSKSETLPIKKNGYF